MIHCGMAKKKAARPGRGRTIWIADRWKDLGGKIAKARTERSARVVSFSAVIDGLFEEAEPKLRDELKNEPKPKRKENQDNNARARASKQSGRDRSP
jgi:hypothetical protein